MRIDGHEVSVERIYAVEVIAASLAEDRRGLGFFRRWGACWSGWLRVDDDEVVVILWLRFGFVLGRYEREVGEFGLRRDG
jgi:hypothetical protein